MEVKLVKNFENGVCFSVNRQLILQIVEGLISTAGFKEERHYLYNPSTNERMEIAPEILKFNVAKVNYATATRDNIVFSSLENLWESGFDLTFFRYNTDSGEVRVVKKIRIPDINVLEKTEYRVFVFNNDYCMLQIYDGSSYEIMLINISKDTETLIDNELLNNHGIDKLLFLNGNNCAIKLGNEIIGIINGNRFVSDLILGLDDIYMEYIEQGNEDVELLYMRKFGDNILWTKIDRNTGSEELIAYDYKSNVRKIRLNGYSSSKADFKSVFIIDGVIYSPQKTAEGLSIINLNTQKQECVLDSASNLLAVSQDVLVTGRRLDKMLFLKGPDIIEMFRFPDTDNPIYSVRGEFKGCIQHYDDLIIFM